MIMFVPGEGGTGKTFLINQMAEYARIRYGKQKGIYGSVVKTAPTGSITDGTAILVSAELGQQLNSLKDSHGRRCMEKAK